MTCIGRRLAVRWPIAMSAMLLFRGATPASAQPSALPPGPAMGESVRLWWYYPGIDSGAGPVGTDSVACGRFREIRGDTMIVTRLDGSRGQRACGTAPRPRRASAPIDVHYRMADIRAFHVHRPREARRVAWTDARQGMGEGALIGLALGAVFGSIVGRFDEGRVIEDGLLGAGIGTVTGTIGGGVMSYQSGYNGGWVWMTVPRPVRR